MILVLRNFHKFLGSAEVIQALDSQVVAGKQARTFVVILAPVVQIPVELEKLFVVVDHDLPGRDQLGAIARGVATEPGELPDGDGLDAVLDAAAGLTRLEAENAFSLALVRHGRLAPGVLWELKGQALVKSGLLTLHRGGETFADLGGLDALKAFCSRALRPGRPAGVRARGVLLLGPPGSGKSAVAKALGRETGRPTLILGRRRRCSARSWASREANVRQALQIVDAMAPCVVMVDEVEKALAGSSGASGDSGVSARLFGTLLTWLNDHESDAFVVCTANDIARLPPEFARAERLDACFFLDLLPGPREREQIWRMYAARSIGLDPGTAAAAGPGLDRWWRSRYVLPPGGPAGGPAGRGGAEHRPGGRDGRRGGGALGFGAAGRCLAADRPGIYTRDTDAPGKPGRNVRRDPSDPTDPDRSATDRGRDFGRRKQFALFAIGGPGISGNWSDFCAPSQFPGERPMTTLLDHIDARPAATAAAGSTTTPAQRLRTTMAAVRVSWTWLGTQKTLTPEQRAQAAEAFDAEARALSAGKKILDVKHPAFRAVTAVRGKAEAYVKGLTLPFPEPGVRLIKHDQVEPFAARMEGYRAELGDAVAELDRHYGDLKEAAADAWARCSTPATTPRPWSASSASPGSSPASSPQTIWSSCRRAFTRRSGPAWRPASRRPSSSPSRPSRRSSPGWWPTSASAWPTTGARPGSSATRPSPTSRSSSRSSGR